jgi:1-acyl-sn-glycerol-3-phosphate acyltransferase
LDRIWLILFPEGTRSKDGYINMFKRGVSLFAIKTETPILFLYLEGNNELWPKGRPIPFPGVLKVHLGPVHPPAPIEEIYEAYRQWVMSINPSAYRPAELEHEDEDDLLENIPGDDLEDE